MSAMDSLDTLLQDVPGAGFLGLPFAVMYVILFPPEVFPDYFTLSIICRLFAVHFSVEQIGPIMY